ncbi:MAG: hypothetical protein NVSMB64_00130 [Candidatus Velthaea sp.]
MASILLRPANRRFDRVFFTGIVLLALVAVFVGYAHTYDLAGLISAPLPNLLIHVHAVVFTSFLILLAVQTGLVSAGRVGLHRRLGTATFALAALMIVLGLFAATDALHRAFAPPGLDALTFYIIPITDIAIFTLLIALAYRERRVPAAHKRFVILSVVAILGAAIARWPFPILQANHWYGDAACYAFLLVLVIYDLIALRKVHPVTLFASALIVIVQQVRIPLGMTGAWHAVANLALGK